MADTPDLGKLWKQLTNTVGGGVSDVLTKLKDSSIGEQVQSWIGKGENKPVTADQLSEALGPDHLDKIAKRTGTTPEQAAQTMAARLPGMVDKLTPDGRLPDPQTIKANMSGSATTPRPTPADTARTTATTAATAMGGTTPTPHPPQPTPRPPQQM